MGHYDNMSSHHQILFILYTQVYFNINNIYMSILADGELYLKY